MRPPAERPPARSAQASATRTRLEMLAQTSDLPKLTGTCENPGRAFSGAWAGFGPGGLGMQTMALPHGALSL
jgi:hypothetical protein